MRLLHSAKDTSAQFDDPNLVSCAGLVPVMRLAQDCDLDAWAVDARCPRCASRAGMLITLGGGDTESLADSERRKSVGVQRQYSGTYAPGPRFFEVDPTGYREVYGGFTSAAPGTAITVKSSTASG